jgi:hypothetical protein
LIDGIRGQVARIEKAIEEGKIKKEDFDFEKYFGPEIIP